MNGKEINKLVKVLYKAVREDGWSSHKYYDADWSNLYRIREICNNVLPDGYKLICQHIFGYGESNDSYYKQYLFGVENTDTGECIIDALVTASAAGRVDDVWSAYDCTCVFYEHED